jgi:hypothetical protein
MIRVDVISEEVKSALKEVGRVEFRTGQDGSIELVHAAPAIPAAVVESIREKVERGEYSGNEDGYSWQRPAN